MSICSRSQTNHCIAQPSFVNINGPGLAMRLTRRHVTLAAMSCIAYSHITNTEIIVLSSMRKRLWMTHDQAEWWLSRVPSSESLFPTRHLHFATQFRQSASASRNTSPTAHMDRVRAGDTFITLHNTSTQTLKPHNPTLKREKA